MSAIVENLQLRLKTTSLNGGIYCELWANLSSGNRVLRNSFYRAYLSSLRKFNLLLVASIRVCQLLEESD